MVILDANCGLAWSPGALIGSRAVQGIGAAIMTPTALSIVSTTFEGAERNKALAIWGMLGALGATGGYLIGGPLVDASVAPAYALSGAGLQKLP